MESSNNKNEYKKLLKRFLSPTERNRGSLIQLLKKCFSYVPLPSKQSYVQISDEKLKGVVRSSVIPENGKSSEEVIGEAMTVFNKMIRWHSPFVMHNINSPILYDSIALSTMANLYNPNLIWDYVSGEFQTLERETVQQLANLAGWDKNSGGVFTYGGKACLSYAIRMGISRMIPNYSSKGMQNYKPVVLTSKFNHYIVENVCNIIGIGTQACIRVETDDSEVVDIHSLEEKVKELKDNGYTIVCFIASGGSTLNLNIDSVFEIRTLIDKYYPEKMQPFLYFDTVVSWPWLFWMSYDFKNNPENVDQKNLELFEKVSNKLSEIKYADAYGIDFHKMGFAAYSNSSIIVRNKEDLHSIFDNERKVQETKDYGSNFMQSFTFEHSRSGAPIISAWSILQSLGFNGFRTYLLNLMKVAEVYRKVLPNYGFKLVNDYTLSHVSVFIPINEIIKDENTFIDGNEIDIKMASEYIYELTEFIANQTKGENQTLLGFLKVLPLPNKLKAISAIRVYPMSPFITVSKAEKNAHIIGKLKLKFDKIFQGSMCAIPEVIHR